MDAVGRLYSNDSGRYLPWRVWVNRHMERSIRNAVKKVRDEVPYVNPLSVSEIQDLCEEIWGPGPRALHLNPCTTCVLFLSKNGFDFYTCLSHAGYYHRSEVVVIRRSSIFTDEQAVPLGTLRSKLEGYEWSSVKNRMTRNMRIAALFLYKDRRSGFNAVNIYDYSIRRHHAQATSI